MSRSVVLWSVVAVLGCGDDAAEGWRQPEEPQRSAPAVAAVPEVAVLEVVPDPDGFSLDHPLGLRTRWGEWTTIQAIPGSSLFQRPTSEGSGPTLSFALSRWGRADAAERLPPSPAEHDGTFVVRDHGDLVEWWLPRPSGLEFGIDLLERPGGEALLRLDFDVADAEDGASVPAVVHDDEVRVGGLSIGAPSAWDARGLPIPTRFVPAHDGASGFGIEVDDADATWPLQVDPIITATTWIIESDEAGAMLGSSASGLGDVNGDGYGDIGVGAPFSDAGGLDSGALWILYGGPTGPGLAPNLIIPGSAGQQLGTCLSHAGDVNGDGFSDVIAGAYVSGGAGSVSLWLGASGGLPSAPSWTYNSPQAGANLGFDCAALGDLQGDGFADIGVGAPLWDETAADQGAAFGFFGGPEGPGAAPDWQATGILAGDHLGWSLAAAGDSNGDGYGDIAVGSPGVNTSLYSDIGEVGLWYGSPTGPGAAPGAVRPGNANESSNCALGTDVAGLGDVDGDGYSDLGGSQNAASGGCSSTLHFFTGGSAIAATDTGWSAGTSAISAGGDINGDGRADIVGGRSGTLSVGFGRTLSSNSHFSGTQIINGPSTFATVVAGAGDVNGDGFADVLAGAPGYDGPTTDEGRLYLYFGRGAQPTAAGQVVSTGEGGASRAVAGLGDVNGDGYDDLAAGNPVPSGGETVRIYHGGPGGLGAVAASTLHSPAPALDIGFGAAVAGGDWNGDGFADVVTAAEFWSNGESNEGAAWVYEGSGTGINTTAGWSFEPNRGGARLWDTIELGDTDGNGVVDLALAGDGAQGLDAFWVFLGTNSGLPSTAHATYAPPTVENLNWARGVGPGDINCDGLDDVILSWDYADTTSLDSGIATVLLGGPDGPATSAAWSRSGTSGYQYYGYSQTGGDWNGDGCGDWYVASYDANRERATFHGNASLSAPSPASLLAINSGGATSGVANVDGDRYADLMVGYFWDSTYRGAVDVFLGTATGALVTGPRLVVGEPNEQRVPIATGDWNGDGFDDVTVGSASTTFTSFSVHYGNRLDSGVPAPFPVHARAVGADPDRPIQSRGRSDSWHSFGLRAEGRAPWGRADVALESDIRPARSDWDAPATTSIGAWVEAGVGSAPSALQHDENGLANDSAHQWRLRVRYADTTGFNQLWGPWQYGGRTGERVGVHIRTAVSPDTDDDLWPDADDCGPLDPTIHPGATELLADEVDSDCDGGELCLLDADDDGGLAAAPPTLDSDDADCQDPFEGLPGDGTDCDDSDPEIGPSAPEIAADGADQDCDGGDLCYADADGDLHWDPAATLASADLDCGDYGEHDGTGAPDCDDTRALVHPGAPEIQGDGLDEDCDGVESCFLDADGDGFRTLLDFTVPSTDTDCLDAGEAALGDPATDCDDAIFAVHPGAVEGIAVGGDQDCDGTELCYADTDDDGYRPAIAATVPSTDGDCGDSGEALPSDPSTDCNDASATVHPNQSEGPGDEVDGNCDGLESCWSDNDGDGARSAVPRASADLDCADAGEATTLAPFPDCDDNEPSIRPGATEVPGDGTDQDCDGADGALCYLDADNDGWGGATTSADPDGNCTDDALQVAVSGDCDDGNPARNPGAADVVGDGVDGDCDGAETCYVDNDGDGFRPAASNLSVASVDTDCADGGEALAAAALGDCDDAEPTVRPGGVELAGDGVDQDCDGTDTALCHLDLDADGFGSFVTVPDPDGSCSGAGQSGDASDCDDGDGSVHPGASEVVGDGVDQDCDDAELCSVDGDSDGFRPLGDSSVVFSADPDCDDSGEGANEEPASDCDDADPARSPGVTEGVADGFDSNCDGVEQCFVDGDGDGYRAIGDVVVSSADLDCGDENEATAADPGGDCDDALTLVFPGATETAGDGIDQDCDGAELCPADTDFDGFPSPDDTVQSVDVDCLDAGEGDPGLPPDCDDLSAATHPGAEEFDGDNHDQDCDGFDGGGTCATDGDGDGWALCLDCDDTASTIHPGATETCDGLDSDCDPSTAEPLPDDPDRDGISACEGDCGPMEPWTFPGAAEGCDGLDSDCDGAPLLASLDHDGDGHRPPPCGDDCDDDDPSVHGGAPEGIAGPDRDCDRVVGGDDLDHDGSSAMDGDCDDGDNSVGPDATERCNGVDDDCDGVLGPGEAVDADHDGALLCMDCDDLDPSRHPGAGERCNGLDDDCDALVGVQREEDGDADGVRPCEGDCDDAEAGVRPRVREVCGNGLDDDCDGSVDVDRDEDQDGAPACEDCDDHDGTVAPGRVEICDGRDDDCDGTADQGFDLDGDGVSSCGGDCDDTNASVHPGAAAICGDVGDEDCLPSTREDEDGDGDGATQCTAPLPDCWEGDPRTGPFEVERCNGLDDDCDGVTDEGLDVDGDGASPCVFDCDDGDPAVGPWAVEVDCDGVDNNCDGAVIDGDVCAEAPRAEVVRPFGCGVGGGGEKGVGAPLMLVAAALLRGAGARRARGRRSLAGP